MRLILHAKPQTLTDTGQTIIQDVRYKEHHITLTINGDGKELGLNVLTNGRRPTKRQDTARQQFRQ